MSNKELVKEIEDTFSPVFRMIERCENLTYQLIKVLIMKGVISGEDYKEHLSAEALEKLNAEIEVALKEDKNE